jgi:predicted cupin superfamily sugar epimerase
MSAPEVIARLGLLRHPEGGWYRETYRSPRSVTVERDGATVQRSALTSIWFLLESHDFSCLHRIASDELWHFVEGDPLDVEILSPEGVRSTLALGFDAPRVTEGVVAPGDWFGARPAAGPRAHGYSLVRCIVAPGFDFADFEMARRDTLTAAWPEHGVWIAGLTRR